MATIAEEPAQSQEAETSSRACMEDEPQEVGLRRQPWLPPTALYTPLARGTDFSKV